MSQERTRLNFAGSQRIFLRNKNKSLLLLKKIVAKVTDYFGKLNEKAAISAAHCADQNL
ncbi:hypothetical protein CSK29544_04235 [Cronobacter sakazakii]|nr:hypothetical protein CSK29544_04235 [Cronobacter sakazakii]